MSLVSWLLRPQMRGDQEKEKKKIEEEETEKKVSADHCPSRGPRPHAATRCALVTAEPPMTACASATAADLAR